jgi:hypothetical protein
MLAATLAMAPIYALRLTSCDKAHCAAQTAPFELISRTGHRFGLQIMTAEVGPLFHQSIPRADASHAVSTTRRLRGILGDAACGDLSRKHGFRSIAPALSDLEGFVAVFAVLPENLQRPTSALPQNS